MEEEEQNNISKLTGTFLTGVNIDVDQWRAQTVEELQGWLKEIKSKKTEFGDPLVDFPEGWDSEKQPTQKEQLDIIQAGITKGLVGPAAKEAQSDLQNVRAQADKLRQLEKELRNLGSDDEFEEPLKEEQDLFDEDIKIPNIDVSGPNPFELEPEAIARLKEIDEKLGLTDNNTPPTKTLDEINQELLQIYSNKDSSFIKTATESNSECEPQSAKSHSSISSTQSDSSFQQPKGVSDVPKSQVPTKLGPVKAPPSKNKIKKTK